MTGEMLLQEIQTGESKTLEFKVELPQKSEKHIKTLIAFANTAGGKLVIGIRNSDREIVGVTNAAAVIDTIANVLTDTVAPMIVPNIYQVALQEKILVGAEIFSDGNCPYYLKSKGKHGGTFVKIGATTRVADEPVLRELEFRYVMCLSA